MDVEHCNINFFQGHLSHTVLDNGNNPILILNRNQPHKLLIEIKNINLLCLKYASFSLPPEANSYRILPS